ncbi:AAA family ATPase [Cellulomonas sp. S1-8]|uniref:AAA family ATPase n=1 Tax=Cellulomonas sp. S1-8 TaxID=2904790 RepID=UPI0022436DE2|nr:ATP-binding protein [Cellulomonas sp. S1-8]UZN01758.1 ATP-binding protein [Cellulomonas sp. S1-8]
MTFNAKSFADRFKDDASLQEIVEDIRVVTKRIGEAVRPQFELEQLLRMMYAGDKAVSLKPGSIDVQVNGDEIPLFALSSGERQLLQMFLLALGGEESSVIIDEPELSLHVDWQETLVESMRALNGRCQLIFATHSPEIMAHIPDSKIRKL